MLFLKTAHAGAIALLMAGPAFAQMAQPATRSFDNDRASGTTTIVRDDGSFSRDTNVIRKSDGAAMTRSTDRTRTDTGFTSESSRMGFDGRTASRSYERTRTDSGFTEAGSATRRNGRTYALSGSRTRTETGYNRGRAVSGSNGTIASRNVDVARAGGQVTRNVTTTGPRRNARRR